MRTLPAPLTTFRTITMPGNAKNPENPHAPGVDALSQFNLLVILEYIEHRGGPASIASLSIGKIPGLLPVIHYIDHERSIGNRPADVFALFRLDRMNLQAAISEDTQELIYVLDDSEEETGTDSPELREDAAAPMPAYLDEEEAAPEIHPFSTASAWSVLPAFFSSGGLNGPQGPFCFFLGSDANPFSM